ncbi:metalloprotease TIKI2, partial [Ailuropoda melanoleuca]|uniref:metalloprotease TIKI2 n=1 Tax=Ailuropoda melanoleuca TaxID=9646 RepID=UPI00149461D1
PLPSWGENDEASSIPQAGGTKLTFSQDFVLCTVRLPSFINTTLPPHEQATAQEIDSYFRHELIDKRKERMGKRVMALLRENEDKICFLAFGAAFNRFQG